MFDVRSVLPPEAMQDALSKIYRENRWPLGRIQLSPYIETFSMLLAADDESTQLGAAVEALMAKLEWDASMAATMEPSLQRLFEVCEDTRRRVVVVSDIAEDAVAATLDRHGLAQKVDAIVARAGVDLDVFMGTSLAERAVDKLHAEPGECLLVSGYSRRLYWARASGTLTIGCECDRERRKSLAMPQTPVVPSLLTLSEALLASR
jgi:beta-phosphoglucomutase-like phosphatase (HAD superfamily)